MVERDNAASRPSTSANAADVAVGQVRTHPETTRDSSARRRRRACHRQPPQRCHHPHRHDQPRRDRDHPPRRGLELRPHRRPRPAGPHAGETADDTFTYTATNSDGQTDTATVTVTVTGVGAPPDAVEDHLNVDEDTILNVIVPGVLANDVVDGPVTVSHLNGATTLTGTTSLGATVTIRPDGALSYDPTAAPALQALDAGETADDIFTYTATNSDGQTDTATVTVTVTGVGAPPDAE